MPADVLRVVSPKCIIYKWHHFHTDTKPPLSSFHCTLSCFCLCCVAVFPPSQSVFSLILTETSVCVSCVQSFCATVPPVKRAVIFGVRVKARQRLRWRKGESKSEENRGVFKRFNNKPLSLTMLTTWCAELVHVRRRHGVWGHSDWKGERGRTTSVSFLLHTIIISNLPPISSWDRDVMWTHKQSHKHAHTLAVKLTTNHSKS